MDVGMQYLKLEFILIRLITGFCVTVCNVLIGWLCSLGISWLTILKLEVELLKFLEFCHALDRLTVEERVDHQYLT